MSPGETGLKRELGLGGLAAYGLGGMLGGGIYALVGEVAGSAGHLGFVAFLLAMLVAAPTALAYAELASRHPRSGGEAWYSRVAFGGEAAPFLVGWLVLFSGVVSMATLSRAFAGYVAELVPGTPPWATAVAFLVGLGLLNLRGMKHASWTNIAFTVIEAGGLVVVIVAGAWFLFGGGTPPEPAAAVDAGWLGLAQGAALAFYAFIGFEDMVNIAEEVREPRRAYPIAIPLALVAVGVIYALVVFVATAVVPPAELAEQEAPLTAVVTRAVPAFPPAAFSAIALFAVANSALLGFIMASRLVYGMAGEGLLPRPLRRVHRRFHTPHVAIAAVGVIACALAVSGGLGALAGATSFLLLGVFFTVNLALLKIRRREDDFDGFRAPTFTPWLGLALSPALAVFLPLSSITRAALVVGAGLLLLLLRHAISRKDRAHR